MIDTCIEGMPTNADNQCDQLDNDCDGVVDEGYVNMPTSCGVGACFNQGNLICTPLGLINTCTEQEPLDRDRRCDGLDTDCDGEIDESYVSRPTSCGVGVCNANGQTDCIEGEVVDAKKTQMVLMITVTSLIMIAMEKSMSPMMQT